MRIIAYVLITVSVIAGSLASSTAYLVRLDSVNPQSLAELRLGSPAGAYDPEEASPDFSQRLDSVRSELDAERQTAQNPLKPASTPRTPASVPSVETEQTGESVLRSREAITPVGRAGDRLTPGLVELLKESDVTFVKVTEFSFARWSYAWLFGLACLGLLIGAMMVRWARNKALESAEAAGATDVESASDASTVFARLSGRLHTLAEDLERTSDQDERLDAILRHIGQIQRDDVPAFVANRAALVNRLSLAGYAELMDSFAEMERQLNRAWSAAADDHLSESESCLQSAQTLVIETLRRLKAST